MALLEGGGAPFRAIDADYNPVSGAKLYVYEAGTSSPVDTFSDSDMSTPQTKPVIANAEGWFPAIYLAPDTYDIYIKDADDVDLPGYPVQNYDMRITRSELEGYTTRAETGATEAEAAQAAAESAQASAEADAAQVAADKILAEQYADVDHRATSVSGLGTVVIDDYAVVSGSGDPDVDGLYEGQDVSGTDTWVRIGTATVSDLSRKVDSEGFSASVTSGYSGTIADTGSTGGNASANNLWADRAMTAPGKVYNLSLDVNAAGTVIVRSFYMDNLNSGTSVTIRNEQEISVTTSTSDYSCDVGYETGDHVGVFFPAGVVTKTTSGGSNVYFGAPSGDASANTPFDISTNSPSTMRFIYRLDCLDDGLQQEVTKIDARVAGAETDIDALQTAVLAPTDATAIGDDSDFSTVSTASTMGNPNNILLSTAMTTDGRISRLEIPAASDGNVIVRSYAAPDGISENDGVTPYKSQTVAVTTGVNDVSVDVDYLNGHYIGIYAPGGLLAHDGTTGNSDVPFGGDDTDSEFQISINTRVWFFRLSYINAGTDLESKMSKVEADVAVLQAGTSSVDFGAAARMPIGEDLATPKHIFIGGSGQSNWVGRATATTTLTLYGALGFENNDDTVVSHNATDMSSNEYPGFGLSKYLREAIMFAGGPSASASSKITIGHAANGGTLISDLDQGSTYYQNGQDQLSASVTYAGANDFLHAGQSFIQGEKDAIDGTTRAAYKSLLIGLATDYDADSRAVNTGDNLRPTFAMQVTSALSSTSYASVSAGWEISQAQLEASEDSSLVGLVGPMYHVGYDDDRHPTASGYNILGGLLGRAWFKWLSVGAMPEPLKVVNSYIDGENIILLYNKTGLSLDTDTVPLQAQYGFSVDNSGTDVPCTVTASGNKVTLACDSTPASGWGWTYGKLEAVNMSPYFGGAGNLRDNAGLYDQLDGHRLDNWAVLQEGTV